MKNPAIILIFVYLGALGACARTSSGTEPVTPVTAAPAAANATPVKPSGRTWMVHDIVAPLRYRTTITTETRQTKSTDTRVDTLTTHTTFDIAFRRTPDSTIFSGSVQNLEFVPKGEVNDERNNIHLPFAFFGLVTHHTNRIQTEASPLELSSSCTKAEQTIASAVQRIVPRIPTQIAPGQTWQDSTETTACNGHLLVTTKSIRSYRVLGESNPTETEAVAIQIDEKTLSTGEGSENEHQIHLQGSGASIRRIYINPETGALLGSAASGKADFSIQGSGRNYLFNQSTTETTELIK